MASLTQLALKGVENGFDSNKERKEALSLLLHLDKTEEEYEDIYSRLVNNLDESTMHVIDADVKRSLQSVYDDKEELKSHRESLKKILINVFSAEPKLRYYQGFHDVTSGIYLVYCDKENPGDREIYTCSEAARRILRSFLTEYAHPNSGKMLVQANKLFLLTDKLIPAQSGKIKNTQFGILSFFPILITLGIHRVFDKRTILRCIDYCIFGGKYSPFYLCCAIVDNTKIPEDESIELGNKPDADRVLLSGLRYGYRDEDVDEFEYMEVIFKRAAEMMKEIAPNEVFPDATDIEHLVPKDIDEEWKPDEKEEDGEEKGGSRRRKRRAPRPATLKYVFVGLSLAGIAALALTGFFGVRRLKARAAE